MVLERFAEARFEVLPAGSRDAFERLLEVEDDLLIDWLITGREQPGDDAFASLVKDIRRTSGL